MVITIGGLVSKEDYIYPLHDTLPMAETEAWKHTIEDKFLASWINIGRQISNCKSASQPRIPTHALKATNAEGRHGVQVQSLMHLRHFFSQAWVVKVPLLATLGLTVRPSLVAAINPSTFSPIRVVRHKPLSATILLTSISMEKRCSSQASGTALCNHSASLSTYSTLWPLGPSLDTTCSYIKMNDWKQLVGLLGNLVCNCAGASGSKPIGSRVGRGNKYEDREGGNGKAFLWRQRLEKGDLLAVTTQSHLPGKDADTRWKLQGGSCCCCCCCCCLLLFYLLFR